ncbi:hypothetical protein [Lutibacter sp. B1]|uniref:hypothetical protein n=1 Tax=Lutibacter sp. B1 TaxID=2725996 RepID=UPI001456357F|nr:hypothetical protein [Lutibacter sp. B1]NLP56797.1 hypothetical protein [Lutibacter sp. B1]
MNFLKRIVNFYVFSNIHVALAGYSITKITLINFGLKQSLVPLFVGISIIISYNFIRYYEIKSNKLNWFKKWFYNNRKELLFLTLISVLILAYITFFGDFNLSSIIVLFPFAFITFYYVIPIFKNKNTEFSFRNYPSLKIFSIAIAWAGISVFFPLYEAGYIFDRSVYIEFVQRILIVLAITIPFDIRDIETDPDNLKTLPQVYGIKKSKIIGTVVLIAFCGLEILKIPFYKYNLVVIILISIISGLFLWFSSPQKSRFYTGFWVESVPVIWLGLNLLFLKN